MEYFYTAYIKKIADKNYFFIKRYMVFPELKNAERVLDGYGMHTDFHRACSIAGIHQIAIKEKLWEQVANVASSAEIIHVQFPTVRTKKILLPQFIWRLPLLKLKFRF